MLGRTAERHALDALVTSARNGVSGALVLVGEAGIGKTALLDHAAAAERVRVVRLAGIESEAQLSFSAVHLGLLPFLDGDERIPARQRDALRIAFGRESGPPPDRFLVGLATLSLLAEASRAKPVVCCIDDVHWLDPESLDVFAFVARRLKAERIAMVFASRPDEAGAGRLSGIPELPLAGLEPQDAIELLTRSSAVSIEPLAAAQIAAATGGNPLALIDLSQELTARQLVGQPLLPEPVPLGRHLEEHYVREARAVPEETQRWLLLASAATTGETALVADAAAALGLADDAAEAAEAAGLVTVGESIEFRHPLVRSAVYGAADGPARRIVHRALADAADAPDDADLRAWHLAAAQLRPDEAIAAELTRAAARAGERGGVASRARLLARAVELTPEGPARDQRTIEAAEAAGAAGAAHAAVDLLDRLETEALDDVSRGRVIAARATLATLLGDPAAIRHATADLMRAADAFRGTAPELERAALLRAFDLALNADFLMQGTTLAAFGERALAAVDDDDDGADHALLRAIGLFITRPYSEAVPALRAAQAMLDVDDPDIALRYGMGSVAITTGLWDEVARERLLRRAAEAARSAGSLTLLDALLWIIALCLCERGRLRASAAAMEQVRQLREAIGYAAEHVENAGYLGWVGGAGSRETISALAEAIGAAGFGGAEAIALMGLTALDLADGRYDEAAVRLEPMVARRFIQVTMHQVADFVEAAARSGRLEAARESAADLRGYAEANGSAWCGGVAARSTALVVDDVEAERWYVDAIAQLERTSTPMDLARAHLLYGEWLRRMRRRRDAREHLRLALTSFAEAGAVPYADRARRELAAAGEAAASAPLSTPTGPHELTVQESAVARMAADGATNAEIAAALFISPNTVDYHLRKVFRILGVTSRRQLAQHFPARRR